MSGRDSSRSERALPLVPWGGERSVVKIHPPTVITVLGATGSIGQQTLELVRRYPDRFVVHGLAAYSNVDLLSAQAREHRARIVAIGDPACRPQLEERLRGTGIAVRGGPAGIDELAADRTADAVVAAIVGVAGLRSVLSALGAGRRVALANKESLVCGGALVRGALTQFGGELLPVDSEHAALFHALTGHPPHDISRLILTASGGPFFRRDPATWDQITPAEAVRHPRWSMGAKISIDSATLVNKALEVIEAHWLFGFAADELDVIIHPQSIVHSLVEFIDGTQLAHLSRPDMVSPIAAALTFPHQRCRGAVASLNLAGVSPLEFFPLPEERFPAIALAKECLRGGGVLPAAFNVANEVAVQAFRSGEIGFPDIVPLVRDALPHFSGRTYSTLEELEDVVREVEQTARARISMKRGA